MPEETYQERRQEFQTELEDLQRELRILRRDGQSIRRRLGRIRQRIAYITWALSRKDEDAVEEQETAESSDAELTDRLDDEVGYVKGTKKGTQDGHLR